MEGAPSKKKFNPFLPILFALVLIVGVVIGKLLSFPDRGVSINKDFHATRGKIDNVLDYIVARYVDTIKRSTLEDKTLLSMLHNLDPHSNYIPASELEGVNESLQGNFQGIGVEFNIVSDTIRVITVISGGPSEKAGLQAGDRIVKVDGKNIAGVKISNNKVFETLRGKSGTQVKVGIKRSGTKELFYFAITRGEIPLYSIDIAYIISPQIGYIRISRFGATTFKEYIKWFKQLKKQGMNKLILDLRGNPGGYLNTAVELADEFLSSGMQIVYTKGKANPKEVYTATSTGGFENNALVVLVDEGSASASEIIAGAVQDNDRGMIIGRRTFGKGLVQEQMELPDGSALRLTTARYYTPSGRCIQKSYKNGNDAYYEEEYNRYASGEMISADSIKFADSLKFQTVGGKTVYGGGGIMPDLFVGLDTSYRSAFLTKAIFYGDLNGFAFSYADKHRSEFKVFKNFMDFTLNYTLPEIALNEFLTTLTTKGIKWDDASLKRSQNYLSYQLKAMIGRNIYGNNGYYPVINLNDNIIKKAISELNKSKN